MGFFSILVIVYASYEIVSLIIQHREKMAKLKQDNKDDK